MSWIAVTGGYRLQCDCCGYSRGSLYKSDGVNGALVRGAKPVPFKQQRLPGTWQKWPQGGDDAHMCPKCAMKELLRPDAPE